MSYYNYVLKCIKINIKDIKEYIEDEDYSVFFEGCKDFDSLKNIVGISCTSSKGDIIVLSTVTEGSVIIRPRDLTFPDNTFYGEAGCFVVLKEIDKKINKDVSVDSYIKKGIKEYLKYDSTEDNYLIMAY